MGELDFRKKRKNTNIRGTARKQGKNSRQRELRFENEKREKRSSGKRWGKNKKNTKKPLTKRLYHDKLIEA